MQEFLFKSLRVDLWTASLDAGESSLMWLLRDHAALEQVGLVQVSHAPAFVLSRVSFFLQIDYYLVEPGWFTALYFLLLDETV